MKITLITPALAAMLGLALASATITAQAQTTNMATAPAAPSSTKAKTNKINYNGAITVIDTTANTVTVASKSKKMGDKTLTLAIAATTKISRDKTPAKLTDFAVGEKVTGSYVLETSGTMTAVKLTFTTPKAKASKSPAPAMTAPAATTPAPAAAPMAQ